MGKKSIFILSCVLIITSMTLSACSFSKETSSPAPAAPESAPPQATESPALPTIDLVGPQRGTTMAWVDGSTLVFVPEGKYIMGQGGEDNPEHEVRLSEFWIYRNEVTNQQFALCVATGKCSSPVDAEANARLADPLYRYHPVTDVTWEQAAAYCQWIEGYLPSEAQWEKAARGPDGSLYPWGEGAPSCELGNFNDCTGQTSEAGDFPQGKSYYDVLDMSGNVYEWVADWYKAQYYNESPSEDPVGPKTGEFRSIRSSGYGTSYENTLPAMRRFLAPDQARSDLGFRCVLKEPTYHPPFCETSALPGTPGGTAPSGNPQVIDARAAGRDCGFATADVTGGKVKSVDGGSLDCDIISDSRVYCTGPNAATGQVTICVEGAALPLAIACPPNHSPDPSDPTRCIFNGAGAIAPACAGKLCLLPGGLPAGGCGVGTYFDSKAGGCVSLGQPGTTCPAGFTFDPAANCCISDSGNYPACFSKKPCVTGAAGAGGNCVTIPLSVGACKGARAKPDKCIPDYTNCWCDTPCP